MVNLLYDVREQLEIKATVLSSTNKDSEETSITEQKWLELYIAYEFTLHFRMTHETFGELLNDVLKTSDRTEVKAGAIIIPIEKCLLICIWYFAKNETLMSIGDTFKVDPATVYDAITVILEKLKVQLPDLIKWPNQYECEEIAEEFYRQGGYPNVIGAINICHIRYKVPTKLYENQTVNHAITVQGICTATKLFTSISVGWPGESQKSKILKESRIGQKVENHGYKCYFFGNKYHLVGDSTYPLKVWLMTSYKDSGQMNDIQKNHNRILNQTRVAIKDAFTTLKGRWQILQNINTYSIERAANVIIGCCVLHNYCILHKDFLELNNDFQ